MFPVIFLDNMTSAAQAILALFAVLAAGLNFMFSARRLNTSILETRVFDSSHLTAIDQNLAAWLVTITLVVAAAIDGWKLKVPNWITFPMILAGWIHSTTFFGWEGLAWSLVGTFVGLGLLLPAYAIGGMGAGDVKLLAGVGAWVWASVTFYAFCLSAIIGGVIALGMVLYRKAWQKHRDQFGLILNEVLTIRDPNQLSAIAAQRKSSMLLLPYGIPIALGTILYFALTGMLI